MNPAPEREANLFWVEEAAHSRGRQSARSGFASPARWRFDEPGLAVAFVGIFEGCWG